MNVAWIGHSFVALKVPLTDHRVIQKLIGSYPRSSVSIGEITMIWRATRRSTRVDLKSKMRPAREFVDRPAATVLSDQVTLTVTGRDLGTATKSFVTKLDRRPIVRIVLCPNSVTSLTARMTSSP